MVGLEKVMQGCCNGYVGFGQCSMRMQGFHKLQIGTTCDQKVYRLPFPVTSLSLF